jgi:curved DNA-binding protein CbpA
MIPGALCVTACCVLLLQVHPDWNRGDNKATLAFQLLQNAYEAMLNADLHGLVIGCELGV